MVCGWKEVEAAECSVAAAGSAESAYSGIFCSLSSVARARIGSVVTWWPWCHAENINDLWLLWMLLVRALKRNFGSITSNSTELNI